MIDWPTQLARHGKWLRTVILARTGEPQAVDEVLQEVALGAVAQKAPIRDASKITAWLYRLALYQSRMYCRKQGRRRKTEQRYAGRAAAEAPVAGTPQPLGWLLAGERAALVRAALNRLPPQDAEILLLKYTEDWSYRQIADHLGISASAVQSRLHRARGRLRADLTAAHVVEPEP
jgi:RNA polymerase sigma-70 factor (ECF subfamily)